MALVQYLNRAWLEAGAVKRLARELDGLGVKRPLLCTDPGIVASGLVDKVHAHWPKGAAFAVFEATPANPTAEAVRAALDLYRKGGCDGLVGLGGGSPIDLAKGVALMLVQKEPLEELDVNRKGSAKIGPLPPLVAIPTTAGTGSEVSIGAIIVTDDGRKATFASRHLVPPVALCDPELTLGLPARLTAATGMDAVAHCIETYLSPVDNPVADALALDGLRRSIKGGALRRAVDAGERSRGAHADDDGGARRRARLRQGPRRGACDEPFAGAAEGPQPASRHAERRAPALRLALQRGRSAPEDEGARGSHGAWRKRRVRGPRSRGSTARSACRLRLARWVSRAISSRISSRWRSWIRRAPPTPCAPTAEDYRRLFEQAIG